MASSPKSSSYSAFAPSSSSSSANDNQATFGGLPIYFLKSKIVEKIQENRVTVIVGETGCGKSSQVPQFLLEENMGPILCTQPRRFAVVAVARMVAHARGGDVGEEVGYHIGHSRVLSSCEYLGDGLTELKSVYQQRVLYLEQVTELLGISSESLALRYTSAPRPSLADADIKPEVHKLIHDLVLHIHKNEQDMEKSILVFLPTYHDLEQQWFLLKRFTSAFKIHILHSSIDTEQALRAMKIWKSRRKVILATNIAESSVTIPKVAYVIDSCRSLQVSWDYNRKKEASDLVWVSRSQA